MNCPTCQHPTTQVSDSRAWPLQRIVNEAEPPQGIKRRRRCPKCGYRFFTLELPHSFEGDDLPVNTPRIMNGTSTHLNGLNGSKVPSNAPQGKPVKSVKQQISEALRRARARIALEVDEVDLSEFDEEEFE